MKKHNKLALLILPVFVGAVAGFAACDTDDNSHTHTFGTGWEYDTTAHWHGATCEHTGETSDKAAHQFTTKVTAPDCDVDGYTVYTCACGYSYRTTQPATGHTFDMSKWEKNEASHWHGATCGHYSAKADQARHDYGGGWKTNADEHWRGCKVCGAEKAGTRETHTFDDQGVCGGCGASLDDTQTLLFTLEGSSYTVTLSTKAKLDETVTSVEIPATHSDKPVTKIAENAFLGAQYLTEITIPSSVTEIEDYAFQDCSALTAITLPAGLTTLGNQVFAGCKELASVNIPAAITELGVNLFLDCEELATVTINSDLEIIRAQAFANCKKLTSFTIPSTVTYIGMKAFKGTGLTEITVPASVKEIHSYAFQDCAALETATINASNTNFTGAIFNGCTSLQTLTIPFVGQDEHPLDVQTPAFGFIFGTYSYGTAGQTYAAQQYGKTYYIPTSLTTLTVNGGQIKAGAFDNVSLTSVLIKADVEVLAGEFVNCDTQGFDWEQAPTLTNVKFLKDGATVNTVDPNDVLTLSCETGYFTKISVAVKKDGVSVTEGYSFNAATKALTFTAPGTYAVEVTATRGGEDATDTVNVTVSDPSLAKAEVEFAWSGNVATTTASEGAEVTFTAVCNYGAGITQDKEEYSVYVLNNGNYENASEDSYVLDESANTVMFKVGGTYRVFLTVTTLEGAITQKHIDITVSIGELEFTTVTAAAGATESNGWVRVVTDTEQTFTTTVSGYLAGYDVEYVGANGATVTESLSETTLTYTVSASAANTATIKAVYTHKNDSEYKSEVEFPAISFITAADAPVLAADAFGGTYGELVVGAGLMLYYDVTSDGTQVAAENVTFEAGETALQNGGAVAVNKLVNGQYYVAVNDSTNNANGKITVKMTATVDGKTAAASKTFTVKPAGDSGAITNYIKAVVDEQYVPTNMSFIGNDKVRNNMVVSKTGIVHYREGGDAFEKELLRFDINTGSGTTINQYKIEFKFTVLQDGNDMNLMFGFRQGDWNGWVGQLGYRPNYVEKSGGGWEKTDKLEAQGWSLDQGENGTTYSFHETDSENLKSAAAGTVIYGRVSRTVNGDDVSYTAEWADSPDGEYTIACKYTSTGGTPMNKTYAMQIGFSGSKGYYLENMVFTVLD